VFDVSQSPMVTLHITLDPVVPFQHEYIYQDMVTQAGRGNFLTVIPVSGDGHCNFSGEQINSAFGMLVQQASAQPGLEARIPQAIGWRSILRHPIAFVLF